MREFVYLILTLIYVFKPVSSKNVQDTVQISRAEFDSIKNTVGRLEVLAEHQAALIQELQTENQGLKSEIKQLQSDLTQQHTYIQDLQMASSEHVIEKEQQTDQTKEFEETSDTAKTNTKKTRSFRQSEISKRHADNTVAFFATITQHYEDNLGAHQNILFDDTLTNIGNAYNSHQGAFIAPVSGLYLVATSVLSRQNEEFWASVVVNGTVIVRLNGRGTDGRHGTGAQTLIMALKKGDDVSVRNDNAKGDYWGDKYSSFGGFLIQEFEMEPSSIIG